MLNISIERPLNFLKSTNNPAPSEASTPTHLERQMVLWPRITFCDSFLRMNVRSLGIGGDSDRQRFSFRCFTFTIRYEQ